MPIDGSKSSFDGADYGLSVARQFGSEVIVVHVIPPLTKVGHSSGVFGLIPPGFSAKEKEEAEGWFVEIRKEVSKLGVPGPE